MIGLSDTNVKKTLHLRLFCQMSDQLYEILLLTVESAKIPAVSARLTGFFAAFRHCLTGITWNYYEPSR